MEQDWDALNASIFDMPEKEGAAYLICGTSITTEETRLIVREVVPVAKEHYCDRAFDGLSIVSDSYVAIAKRAQKQKASIVFVHSHPEGYATFSKKDDAEDPKLHSFFQKRVPDRIHGSLVITNLPPDAWDGRVWLNDAWATIDRVRIIGRRFRILGRYAQQDASTIPEFFDRQVRAFGPEAQKVLAGLHVGVVGVGGTGSAVVEQLTRLGVGKISVFDLDSFEGTNVNRVYGSTSKHVGQPKSCIAKENIERIGLGTNVQTFGGIHQQSAAKQLRDCDFLFGCTDKHAPRGILMQVATRYLIPVFDLGAVIESKGGVIQGIYSRVTTYYPGEACLFCRGRIDPETIMLESLPTDQRAALVKEGYAKELQTNAPAVIMFTTAAATQAVCELLHRLTGFMGSDRESTEIMMRFHSTSINRNRHPADPNCFCSQPQFRGRGDSRSFLDLSWPSEG